VHGCVQHCCLFFTISSGHCSRADFRLKSRGFGGWRVAMSYLCWYILYVHSHIAYQQRLAQQLVCLPPTACNINTSISWRGNIYLDGAHPQSCPAGLLFWALITFNRLVIWQKVQSVHYEMASHPHALWKRKEVKVLTFFRLQPFSCLYLPGELCPLQIPTRPAAPDKIVVLVYNYSSQLELQGEEALHPPSNSCH